MKNWQQVAIMNAIIVASGSLSKTVVHAEDESTTSNCEPTEVC